MLITTPGLRPGGFAALPIEHQHRLRIGLAHVSALGPRPLAELVVQIVAQQCDLPEALDVLDQWRSRLTPEMVAAVGADRYPARALRELAR